MTSLRILLVDDDASVGALLAEMLEGMGHIVCGIETTEAGAVRAALDTAPDQRPDLMIVDANLREGNGLAAVATIALTASIPSILMSGQRIPDANGKAILQKPFMYRDLVAAIERAVAAAAVRTA